MKKRENIIVMGGSFNPPTIAHLKLVQATLDALDAGKGYLVPVSHAYLKRKMVRAGCGHMCIPVSMRLEMLRAMVSDDARLSIYEGEIHEPFAITIRTMEQVQERHPEACIWFIAGEDKLDLLENLTRKYAFLPRFGAVVFARGGDLERKIAENEVLSPFRDTIAVIEPPAGIEGISSTAVREHLFDPDAVADMLHPAVLSLVRRLREKDFPVEIIAFKNNYAFLGNDYPALTVYDEIAYPSAEAAFQASKSDDPAERRRFSTLKPDSAKQKGSRIEPWPGWEEARPEIMRAILRAKFSHNPELMTNLMATGDCRLLNGTKKDKYWGINLITWEGENLLGKLLMELRETVAKGE